jgi:MFS family permease
MTRKLFILVVVASMLSSLTVGLIGPIYPIFITENISASILDVGMIYAIFYAVGAFVKLPAGKLSDKYGKGKLLFIGGILGAGCTFGYTMASTLEHLIIIEILNGSAYALARPAMLSLLAEITNPTKRGFQMGFFDSIYDFSIAGAAFLAGIIISAYGFGVLFYLCSILQISSGALAYKSVHSIDIKY